SVHPPPSTLALFVTEAGASEATSTVTVMSGYESPAASTSERVHFGSVVQSQPVPAIAVTVRPVGGSSVTVTWPAVGPSPVFLTAIVYWPLWPGWKSPLWVLVTCREACVMSVGSVPVEQGESAHPPPSTLALFVTEAGASEATSTVTVIFGYESPAASTSERVHFGSVVQSQPVPAIAVTVSPVGGSSVTVTWPAVGPSPTFLTAIVYSPL